MPWLQKPQSDVASRIAARGLPREAAPSARLQSSPVLGHLNAEGLAPHNICLDGCFAFWSEAANKWGSSHHDKAS